MAAAQVRVRHATAADADAVAGLAGRTGAVIRLFPGKL